MQAPRIIICKNCGKKLQATADLVGKTVRCPACTHRIVVANVELTTNLAGEGGSIKSDQSPDDPLKTDTLKTTAAQKPSSSQSTPSPATPQLPKNLDSAKVPTQPKKTAGLDPTPRTKEVKASASLPFDDDEYQVKKEEVVIARQIHFDPEQRDSVERIHKRQLERERDMGLYREVPELEKKADRVLVVFAALIVVAVFIIKAYEISTGEMDYIIQACILFPIVGIGIAAGVMYWISKFQEAGKKAEEGTS